ncbi:hypothetical protein LX77_01558 [Gelidibacter algens]|uniref:Uncharacterized protein n=1 Tax=Gelidibacter algens TaxID=49280 RepID=A0A327S8E6_9FLAO|nr:hypothetical protein LX77_01558 [Gelidibacter algens]
MRFFSDHFWEIEIEVEIEIEIEIEMNRIYSNYQQNMDNLETRTRTRNKKQETKNSKLHFRPNKSSAAAKGEVSPFSIRSNWIFNSVLIKGLL